jgi:ornithine carbamoyltransferase
MATDSVNGKSLLSWETWSPEEIHALIDLSIRVKEERKRGEIHDRLKGKTVALIFEKRSTRTRCAFETAVGEEGGHPVFLSTQDIQLGAKESVEDTARVLGRMFDAIQFRGYKQATVETLARHSGVPVYNGLTDAFHPTQALADMMTMVERFGTCSGKKLCFIGDGRNNVARSLMLICAKLGVHFSVTSPRELFPDREIQDLCAPFARESGAIIRVNDDLTEVERADVLYTDVWTSMGEEHLKEERKSLLRGYQVNAALMARTGKEQPLFLHCLPAVKGEEVTVDVIDGPQSGAWDQAENRKHSIKAILLATLGLAGDDFPF